ncbi:MAG TPA: hypothetical protein VMA72_03730 [Streptosporangiaceae bacterium]|nr:hypothetical protein [Streptosporangiaceae bacterium]
MAAAADSGEIPPLVETAVRGGVELPTLRWTPDLSTPLVKEARSTRYQFTRPLVIDSTRLPMSWA